MDDVGLVDVDEPRWGFSFADDTVDFGWAVAEDTFDEFAAGFRMLGMIKRLKQRLMWGIVSITREFK